MNSDMERIAGCYHCHGTVLKMKGDQLDPDTWPNVGVGRINLDGSKGSCSSCHTRHRFSVMEARKPEACGQCHLGPDHPQIEIYMESKHGDIYTAFGDEYNWNAAPGTWTPGVDFRAPTCAACHMSGSGPVLTSHDVTERLSWELQAPLTVRPSEFAAFPAKTNWQTERTKMKDDLHAVPRQKLGGFPLFTNWIRWSMNTTTSISSRPKRRWMSSMQKDLLDKSRFFDERLEVEFYELWHHEGRRARMGAAMMAPDYSWWHGFYECKKRYNNFMEECQPSDPDTTRRHTRTIDFPGATGSKVKPPEVFGKQ